MAAFAWLATASPAHAILGWHLPWHLGRWFHRDRWIELREPQHRPIPTADDKRDGLIPFSRSPLERIYPDSRPRDAERAAALALRATRDEYEPAQIGVYGVRDLHRVSVGIDDLTDDAGDVLPAAAWSIRMVRFYGASLSSRSRRTCGVVPKTLEPAVPLDVPRGSVRPYWLTVHVPADQPGGLYRGAVRIAHDHGARQIPITVEVIPVRLHEAEALYGTLSINPLAELSHVLAHSHSLLLSPDIIEEIHLAGADALLARAELMLRDQRAHGMNTISPWSAKEYEVRDGHPYVRDIEVAMALVRRLGFPRPMFYQMGTLLHTNKVNRAASYREFDAARDERVARDVAAYYTDRFARAGLPGIIFLPVEEPNLGDGIRMLDPPDVRQKLAARLLGIIKQAGGRTALNCTPASARAVGAQADYWIVAHRAFTPQVYDDAAAAGAQLAIYANAALMGQNTYLPRFLFGYFVWANRLAGMLPWTYPSQPNRFPTNVGRHGEGGYDVRDGFLGSDGAPIPTIQWELAREGIDDARYLTTIAALATEARRRGGADAIAAADAAEAFLAEVRAGVGRDAQQYVFEAPRTYAPHADAGWDAARFEATRARAADLLARLVALR